MQVDGGIRTGRDVVIGALLGADEFGMATAPLIAAGCIMMRKCHLNTCPVGIATQDPVLRKRFTGKPEHVINYLFFVAEEVREQMAALGYRTFDEMVGQMQMLDKAEAVTHWKGKGLDFSQALPQARTGGEGVAHLPLGRPAPPDRRHPRPQAHREGARRAREPHSGPDRGDHRQRQPHRGRHALGRGRQALRPCRPARGHHRHIAHRHRRPVRSARSSRSGVSLDLVGEANDYVGKGLSGGRIVVRPPEKSGIVPEESIIVGNTVLYGAIAGECYFRGVAGERFAVRNSGAVAIVEGTGDHCCEYMTGGVVVVLGKTGRNFAAGMSGGIAYVLDEDGTFESRCNMSMVELEPVESRRRCISRPRLPPRRRPRDHAASSRSWATSGAATPSGSTPLISRHKSFTGSARARDDPRQLGRRTCPSSGRSCRSSTAGRWSSSRRAQLEQQVAAE